MPTQIRSFIDTLQEKQPLRSAFRSLLGIPRRPALDPMEDPTAREAGPGLSTLVPQMRQSPLRQVAMDLARHVVEGVVDLRLTRQGYGPPENPLEIFTHAHLR